MNLTQAAQYIGVSSKTLRLAIERGQIQGMHPLADGPWILKREHLDRPEARQLGKRARQRRTDPTGLMPGQLNLFKSIT